MQQDPNEGDSLKKKKQANGRVKNSKKEEKKNGPPRKKSDGRESQNPNKKFRASMPPFLSQPSSPLALITTHKVLSD